MQTDLWSFTPEVRDALDRQQPVLALESTIISHGMPAPRNLEFADRAAALVREQGAVPATIALWDGKIHLGCEPPDLERLAAGDRVVKVAARDLGTALQKKLLGATTVSATLAIARAAGLKVMATGGIGGVHRRRPGDPPDVSQDLLWLSRIPLVVVSAGAKALLDLPATLEYLETLGIPVLGYRTGKFPAFYSRDSGLTLDQRVENPAEVAGIYWHQRALDQPAALLVANPVPAEHEIPAAEIEAGIRRALADSRRRGLRGPAVTPFILDRLVTLSGGRSLETNLHLALNNARLGAQIAVRLEQNQPRNRRNSDA